MLVSRTNGKITQTWSRSTPPERWVSESISFVSSELPAPSTAGRDYCLTTSVCKTEKAISPVLSRDSGMFGESWLYCQKSAQCLKTQHFISLHLKNADRWHCSCQALSLCKKQDANSCIWVCVLLLPVPTVPPYDTLCTYGVKQLKLLGFSRWYLFWFSLMVDSTGLEPVTPCTSRSIRSYFSVF